MFGQITLIRVAHKNRMILQKAVIKNITSYNFPGKALQISLFHSLRIHRSLSLPKPHSFVIFEIQSRTIGSVGSILSRVLKLRYIIFGSAVGGGVTIHQRYENWKDGLPDLNWVKEYIPDTNRLHKLGQEAKEFAASFKFPELPAITQNTNIFTKLPSAKSITDWLDEVTENDPSIFKEGEMLALGATGFAAGDMAGGSVSLNAMPFNSVFSGADGSASGGTEEQKEVNRLEQIQEEMMHVQIRYQKEIERLEKENRDLRRQVLLKLQKNNRGKKMKRSLIDMYSEVLDELGDYDAGYDSHDHLPRVVVVGDQSAGKTSVLEMIAKARIFPRGSGEMMTRSPVKVTLSEGPYHIARFKDSSREYDLTKEHELDALRKEIELRMKASVLKGETVSSEAISITVKGPGIQRMVLVDLPGIISTVTTGMAADTKSRIQSIAKQQMENPNAIILCIQDGSLDAERSNVTDLVSSMDPSGKRTIFVLTKVDLAENSLINPQRIKKTLEGKLFPMKALGYFAVVTGRGNKDDSIKTIKEYEEEFFRSSRLFRDGILKPKQMTTQNLSLAVSECFWKMVQDSVEHQADIFKARRFNLETEWKNMFPRVRELDRDELFEKARGEILDEIINLSQVTPQQWEEAFWNKLWERTSGYIFENIYLPASQTENAGTFNTAVDIKLKHWAERTLPAKSVNIGMETLDMQFTNLLSKSKQKKGHDRIYDALKSAVKEASLKKHKWDSKAEDSLRVIQFNTLEDRSVHSKTQWDEAVNFMGKAIRQKLEQAEQRVTEMKGPGLQEQWLKWSYKTQEQKNHCATFKELEKLFQSSPNRRPKLLPEEVTTVKKNLETTGIKVTSYFVNETWYQLYRLNFFKRALGVSNDCKKGFFYYQQGFHDSGMNCHDVVLFWRIQKMMQVTSNSLRQQVMNIEARRLERNVKEVLEEVGEDKVALKKYLTGKRVELAEELRKVRAIQELLEEFVQSLNKEK